MTVPYSSRVLAKIPSAMTATPVAESACEISTPGITSASAMAMPIPPITMARHTAHSARSRRKSGEDARVRGPRRAGKAGLSVMGSALSSLGNTTTIGSPMWRWLGSGAAEIGVMADPRAGASATTGGGRQQPPSMRSDRRTSSGACDPKVLLFRRARLDGLAWSFAPSSTGRDGWSTSLLAAARRGLGGAEAQFAPLMRGNAVAARGRIGGKG